MKNVILDNISQGILFVHLSGKVTAYNPAAEQILKMPHDQVINQSFESLFADEYLGFSMKKAFESKSAPQQLYMTLTDSCGEKKELEVSTKFDLGGSAAKRGLIVMLRDISEMRRLQEEASHHYLMEQLGEMATMIAHEIRNPLGGIEGFASLLYRDLQGSPKQQEMASHIIQGTRSLNRLVTNILHYARPMKIKFVNTDLVALLKESVELVKADQVLSKNIEYHFDASIDSCIVPVDAETLKIAVLNLLVNGEQAMPDGGVLKVQLEQADRKVQITISDTGIGIPEENFEKLFSPFFSTKDEGNGLGLSEVKKVIQAHGGKIEVRSAVGRGTAFIITLPLAR